MLGRLSKQAKTGLSIQAVGPSWPPIGRQHPNGIYLGLKVGPMSVPSGLCTREVVAPFAADVPPSAPKCGVCRVFTRNRNYGYWHSPALAGHEQDSNDFCELSGIPWL